VARARTRTLAERPTVQVEESPFFRWLFASTDAAWIWLVGPGCGWAMSGCTPAGRSCTRPSRPLGVPVAVPASAAGRLPRRRRDPTCPCDAWCVGLAGRPPPRSRGPGVGGAAVQRHRPGWPGSLTATWWPWTRPATSALATPISTWASAAAPSGCWPACCIRTSHLPRHRRRPRSSRDRWRPGRPRPAGPAHGLWVRSGETATVAGRPLLQSGATEGSRGRASIATAAQ
jgi:hypothetical protein